MALIALASCDGAPMEPDAGVSIDAGTSAGAATPILGPCPDGWTEREVAGVTVCDVASDDDVVCGAGEARFAGRAACEPVGRACPAGDFAEGLDGAVLYVRPGASGDGTLAAPFGSIAAALDAATPGTTVALAKGTYDEHVALRSGVVVRGACARDTRIVWTTARGSNGAIGVGASVTDAALEDVTVADTDNIGVLVRGGRASLSGVVVESAQLFGVILFGGVIDVQGLVVRGTRLGPSGDQGLGVVVTDGAELTGARIELAGNRQIGLAVGASSRATIEDVAARDGLFGAVPGLAAGLVAEGGTLSASVVEIANARGAAALVTGGGTLELTRGLIRGTRGEGAEQGFAIAANGGVARAERIFVRAAQGTAISALEGSSLTLTDVVVDGTIATLVRPGFAAGVAIANDTQATLSRVLVSRGAAAGVSAIGRAGGARGDTRLVASDLTVLDVEDRGTSGVGVYLSSGVDATIERVRVERATEAAIIVSDDSHLALTEADVIDTRPDALDGWWGRGVEVIGGSDVEITGARFVRQREVALIFADSRGTLRDVEVRDTLERACAESSCGDAPGGIGVGVYGTAEVDVRGFVIAGAPLCGVQIAIGGALDLHDGAIEDAAIGACVQVDGYDITRLADDVAYRDTGANIQSTTHAIPELVPPI